MQNPMESMLEQGLEELGLSLDQEQQLKLLRYVKQMQRWNKTYNLTAITNPQDMLVQHILDSLAVVPGLKKLLANNEQKAATIVDVGTGAGLPGVVLAIVNAQWEVLCIDSVEKKTAFIQQMRGVLELPNLNVSHSRIQDLDALGCDVLISRAFSSLENIIKWCGNHVAPGGYIVAMKGQPPTEELEQLSGQSEWEVEPLIPIDVPFLDAERCLVLLKNKVAHEYP